MPDEIIQITGQLFDGESSKRHTGALFCSPDGAVSWYSEDAEFELSCRADQLKVSARIGNTPRYITLPNQATFETNDHTQVDYVLKHYGRTALVKTSLVDQWAHAFEQAKSFILIALITMVIGSWGFVKYGIPFFSEQIAHALPAELAQEIGSGGLALLDDSLTSETALSEARQHSLIKQFDALLPHDQNNYNFQLVFRQSEALGANAFAFPSGEILFTDDMITLAEHDDELRIIMLHEIGHVVYRHGLQKLIQQSGLALLVFLITGDAGTTSSLIAALPTLLLQANYSQQMETEADSYALEKLKDHDIKPIHFANIMTRLSARHTMKSDENMGNAEESKNSSASFGQYFSTHPATEERVKRFQNQDADSYR